MQRVVLGKTGLEVSRLGFGCMRLPMKSQSEVDREKAIPMLHKAYELGVNYFDTAVGYCGSDSQRVLGEAFEGIRKNLVLSTKNHHYDKSDKEGWWRNLHDSLERLRTDYIDVYKFHGLNRQRFQQSVAGKDGLYREMLKAQEQGLIRHISCSFHGGCDELIELIDTGLFASILLQYNLLDRHNEEGIAHAREKGVAIEVMGPVGGGRLGYPTHLAESMKEEVKSTPELALRFVLSNENVAVAFSGMSTMEQLLENVETVDRSGTLGAEDFRRIEEAIEERKKLAGLYCTGCNYCMPCPNGVDIPGNFEALNLQRVFGLTEQARKRYSDLAGKAALCTLCGKCLESCPQDIDIPVRLGEAIEALDERAGTVKGWSELRGASLKKGALHLKCRYHVKNFTGKPRAAKVALMPHGEDQVRPCEFAIEKMEPYARAHRDLDIATRAGVEYLTMDVSVAYDGRESFEHLDHIVTVARRNDHYSLSPGERRPGTHHVPAPLHPVYRSEESLQGHSFDFATAYDRENLYVYADVEEDMLCLAKGKAGATTSADHLILFLDGRKPSHIGLGGYEKGVMNLRIFQSAAGPEQVQVVPTNEAQVQVKAAPTSSGYRVDCAIPWASFCQVSAPPPVIGFDIGLVSHDAKGNRVLYLNWTGRTGGQRDPSAFGTLLTV